MALSASNTATSMSVHLTTRRSLDTSVSLCRDCLRSRCSWSLTSRLTTACSRSVTPAAVATSSSTTALVAGDPTGCSRKAGSMAPSVRKEG